ncbi:right-handed parallel beta-helix repeat-containing protein [Paenibacillus sp. L3-i20]|uniref:right-handed parallel beta-helix repeat-containing protein n=1 Tax=Paenibacillus sp. L3-i20 TaxID=2905833 RepID=UPI001EDD5FC8|nr:right-handed parallel beta-helix repeat-containing protein [Paenibacillus sp. L3-i20]GKU78207.1 hypothetical protein L3i20_v226040 [Paenibacillus sp. L3-i20]
MKILKWSLLVSMHLSLLSGGMLGAQGSEAGHQDVTVTDVSVTASTNEQSQSYPFALPTGAKHNVTDQPLHVIDLKKWGIHNDGTKPVETTKGINNALQWASKNGVTATTLPAGTYLIDKNSRINMVSNMLFELKSDVVLQKETNAKEGYHLLHVGANISNVTLRGGVYIGDKDTHDYSKKENQYTPGTHESGYGIMTQGSNGVTIENVKGTHFIGDGLIIGAHGTMISDLYHNNFVSGEFDANGKPVANKEKIRTTKQLRFDHKIFKTNREFEISNPINLPSTFDIYIFDKSKKLISKMIGKKTRETMQIPEGADYFHLVFKRADSKGSYIEFWNRILSSNIVVKDSEFAYNRRQGITVAGANGVLIENNELHHMKGTNPQAGIDVEGGMGENGYLNTKIVIKNNKFHNNALYDVILYDGNNTIVEGNHLASKGKIGVAISQPFTGALVRDNHFDGSRIFVYDDATFLNNRMNDAATMFEGPNVKIDGLTMTNSILSIISKQPFGVSTSNVTITNTSKEIQSGLTLWGKPVQLDNITISGEAALHSVSGRVAPGSIINNLKVINYNSKTGVLLPPATYNNCEFSGAEGSNSGSIAISSTEGPYVFNNCKFKASSTALDSITAQHAKLNLSIKNSSFELLGNTRAVSVATAANFVFENNTIVANKITDDKLELVRINDYWKRNEPHDIFKVSIKGNTITSNLKAIGISTIYAGKNAPSYVVEDNTLVNAKLALKDNDTKKNNVEK